MLQVILDFPKQFKFQPVIKNQHRFKKARQFIILGLGGSNLTAALIRIAEPQIKIMTHRDYGLPSLTDTESKKHLIIASSYSGNTEEVIDGYKKALAKKLSTIVIATGGKLLALAKKNNLPYIQIPDTKIQPRAALGFQLRAALKAMSLNKHLTATAGLSRALRPKSLENRGKNLARALKNKIPLIYASSNNKGVAYNWKIKFNETGKVPAFANVFPELNHNEVNGFDQSPINTKWAKNFSVIMLQDDTDHKQIIKRMKITAALYKKRGIKVISIKLSGQNIWLKIFNNLLLADWTAYYTALLNKQNPENVPIIEQLKKLL